MNYEKEIENLNKDATRLLKKYEEKSRRIDKAIDFIRKKTHKFTMAYMEEDNKINLGRSEYTIGNLTSKNVKYLLDILKGEEYMKDKEYEYMQEYLIQKRIEGGEDKE